MLFGYKGLVLLYGARLAWETRNVHISLLNDATTIAITIYTVAVLCAVVVPVSIVMEEYADLAYGISATTLIFATTLLQILCIFPKVGKASRIE